MPSNRTLSKRAVVAILAFLMLPLGYSVVRSVLAEGAQGGAPFLEKPGPQHDRCVRDTAYMRFHHMDFLKQIRDETVREGKPTDTGIGSCRQCHPHRARFCDRCHNAVNLHPDCFRCHYYPE